MEQHVIFNPILFFHDIDEERKVEFSQTFPITGQTKISQKKNYKYNKPKISRKIKLSKPILKRVKQQQEVNENRKSGHWTTEEEKNYHLFLQIHHRHFIYKHFRRTDKIFKSMARFVGTREAEQCRSHHQKKEKKFIHFSKVLLNLRQKHYASEDSAGLRADLQMRHISFENDLLSKEILYNIGCNKSELKEREYCEESHFLNDKIDEDDEECLDGSMSIKSLEYEYPLKDNELDKLNEMLEIQEGDHLDLRSMM